MVVAFLIYNMFKGYGMHLLQFISDFFFVFYIYGEKEIYETNFKKIYLLMRFCLKIPIQ